MIRLCALFCEMGIDKIRLTGGEPFARRDFLFFLKNLAKTPGLREITLTTNGVLTAPHIPFLKEIGVKSVNLSLDSLNRQRFFEITRRDELPAVLNTMNALLDHEIDVKINAVVMENINSDDILPLVELTENLPVSVRFIEEMPFNGAEGDRHEARLVWNHVKILETIRSRFPSIKKLPDPPFSTSMNWQIDGHRGQVGIIAAWSRTFCGTCNRIRLTPQGLLKTCLYDGGVLNLKDLLRSGASENELKSALLSALGDRSKDGWEAEKRRSLSPVQESMATIGG